MEEFTERLASSIPTSMTRDELVDNLLNCSLVSRLSDFELLGKFSAIHLDFLGPARTFFVSLREVLSDHARPERCLSIT